VNSEDILHAEQIRALAGSDEIVLTMRLDVVSLHRAKQHLEYLKRNQVSEDHVHVVAIGTGHTGELPVTPVKKILGVSEIHCVPDDPIASIASVNVGNPLVLESPKSKCAQAIAKITAKLSQLAEIDSQVTKRWKLPSLKAASF
jgi:pilus assembly protein CpaE